MDSNQKADIRRRFCSVETANASDVLDSLGHPHQALAASFLKGSS